MNTQLRWLLGAFLVMLCVFLYMQGQYPHQLLARSDFLLPAAKARSGLYQPPPRTPDWNGIGPDPFFITPWGNVTWLQDVSSQIPSVDCATMDVAPAEQLRGIMRVRELKLPSARLDVTLTLDLLFCYAQWQNYVLDTATDEELQSGRWAVFVWDEYGQGLSDALGQLGLDLSKAFRARALFFYNDIGGWYHGEHHPLNPPMNFLWHENSKRFGIDFAPGWQPTVQASNTGKMREYNATHKLPFYVYAYENPSFKDLQDPVLKDFHPPPWDLPTQPWLYQPSAELVDIVRGTLQNRSTYFLVGMHLRTYFLPAYNGSTTDWLHCFKALEKKHADKPVRVFIASDSAEMVANMKREFADGVALVALDNGVRSHSTSGESRIGTLSSFVDFFTLQRSDFFLATVQSTWERVASFSGMPRESWVVLGRGPGTLPDWCNASHSR